MIDSRAQETERARVMAHAQELRERVTDWLLESAMGYTERFELGAERFYQVTGFLAPGKSEPFETHGGEARERQRQEAWDTWQAQQKTTYQQDLRDLRDLLAMVSSPCPPAWQAIETAPKDGTEILVYCENRAGLPGIVVAHYADWVEDHPPIDQAFYYWNGGQFTPATKPRLWMPRPPLPPVPPHGELRTE